MTRLDVHGAPVCSSTAVSEGRPVRGVRRLLISPSAHLAAEECRDSVRRWALTEALEATHTLRRRSYLVMIFPRLSRLAFMDSGTEFFPLIHAPPSRNRDWRISSVTVPQSNTSVTTVASSPSGVRM